MAKRRSINFPGFKHQNPIPNASMIGNLMMSSVMSGADPGTRDMPADLSKQVVNLFRNIRACVEAAGGTPEDILKVEFWMKDPTNGRAALNEEWVRLFPDENTRPARHTMALEPEHRGQVTCCVTAVIGAAP